MSKLPRNELAEYVTKLGQHVNNIYGKFKDIEAKIDELSKEIESIKDFGILTEDLKLPTIYTESQEVKKKDMQKWLKQNK